MTSLWTSRERPWRHECDPHRVLVLLALALLGTWSTPLQAQVQATDTEVDLSYKAPEACPARQAFQRATAARTRTVRWGGPDARRQLSVLITRRPEGYRGSLTVSTDRAPSVRRTLENQTCAALVDALALVAAMDLEFALAHRERTGVRVATQTASRAQEQRGVRRPVPGPDGRDTRDIRQDGDRKFDQLIAVVGGVAWAPTPGVLPTGGLHWSMRRRRGSVDVGVSAHYGQTGLRHYERGDVRFRWVFARLLGCPLGVRRAPFAAFACANADIGLLRAEPEHTLERASRTGLWLAPGLGVLASARKVGVAVEVFAGLTLTVVRDRFFFAPAGPSGTKEVVNRPPALGPIAELRLGVPF